MSILVFAGFTGLSRSELPQWPQGPVPTRLMVLVAEHQTPVVCIEKVVDPPRSHIAPVLQLAIQSACEKLPYPAPRPRSRSKPFLTPWRFSHASVGAGVAKGEMYATSAGVNGSYLVLLQHLYVLGR